jgi:hypothetical protein
VLAAAQEEEGEAATGDDAGLNADENVADWMQTAHPEGRGRSDGAAGRSQAGVTVVVPEAAGGPAALVSQAPTERVVSETTMARAILRSPWRKAATGRTPLAQLPQNAACPQTGLRLHTL